MIDSVAAGKHVIAEKPIAATPAEGLQVLQACSGAKSVVMIGENFRYRRDLMKARELVSSGAIGEPFAFDLNVHVDLDAEIRRVWTERPWRREPAHPGGFLLDAGVHPVSFLRDLLGDVCEVYAQTLDRHPIIGGPDTLLMQMKLDNGVAGQYLASYTAKCNRESLLDLTVYGSQATLEVRPGKVEYGHGPATGASFRVPKSDRGYEGQWRNFCDAIRGGAGVVSTPEKAFGDLLVIDAALRSAHEAKPVRLGRPHSGSNGEGSPR
jgi:predicted dehydrogenase